MATFRERLQEYLDYMGEIKQAELAVILTGVTERGEHASRQTISGYLNKAAKTPTYGALLFIADRLGVSLDWLTGRSGASMWAPEIQNARVWLRSQMHRVPGRNDKRYPFNLRMRDVLTVMAEQVPQLSRPWFAAGVLGIPLDAYERFQAGILAVTDPMLQRAAAFTGLTDRWFLSGNDEHLKQPVDLGEYTGVVAGWANQGVKPERLLEIAPIVTRMALQE